MGSCEDSLEVHEPVHQAAIEQHSCSGFIQHDNVTEQQPCLEMGCDLIGSNVDPTSPQDTCIQLSQNDHAGCVSCSDVMEAGCVDGRIGLVSESKNVGLVAGKLLGDECGVSGACMNERDSGVEDCNVETDGSYVEKVVSRGENNGLVNLFKKCNGSLELMSPSGSLSNWEQQDDESSSVQVVKEEKCDGLAAIEADACEEVVASVAFQMPAETIPVNGMPRNCYLQNDHKDDKSSSVQRIKEENSYSLTITESHTCDEIVLSVGCELPAELIPRNGLPENCDQQTVTEEYECGSVEVVMEGKTDGLAASQTDPCGEIIGSVSCEMPAELLPVNGSPRDGFDWDEQKDIGTSPERAILATEEKSIDVAGIRRPSLDHEILSELVPVTGPLSNCVQQDDQKGDEIISCPFVELITEEKSDVLTAIETTTSNHFFSSEDFEKSLELMPTPGSAAQSVQQDGQKHDKPVSSPSKERAMEVKEKKNDPLAGVGTVTTNQILSSLDGETRSKLVTFSGLLGDCPPENEPVANIIRGSAIESAALDGKNNALDGRKADICNQILPYCDEVPTKLEKTSDLVSDYDWQNDEKNDKDANCLFAEKIAKDVETKSGIYRSIQVLPSQAFQKTLENLPLTDSLSNCAEQNELRCDKNGPFVESMLQVVEEACDVTADIKVDSCSQMLHTEGNAFDMKEGLTEIVPKCFVEKLVSLQSCEPIGVVVNGSPKRLDVLYPSVKDAFGGCVVDCTGQLDNEGKDYLRIDSVSETKCHDIVSSSSRRSSTIRKSSWKPQTRRAAGKSRSTANVQDPHASVDITFEALRRKRSCLSKPARSSIWGLLGNITQTFKLSNGLELDEIKNHGSQKAKVGRRSGKQKNSRAGGSSQRSSGKHCASSSCIRLKVKVGKEVGQSSLKIMVPEVIDTLASADVVVSDYGTESHLGTSFENANLANGVEDKVGEKGTENKLQCSENKFEKAKTYSDASVLDVHLANKDLEGTVIFEKPGGDAAEDYLGVSSHAEVEELGVAIEKRYSDPGTSPDSEVINLVPEGQGGARCREDFSDVILSSSKAFAAPRGVTCGTSGKNKDRLPHAGNCSLKDRSPDVGSMSKVKPTKKRGDRQRKGDGRYSSETLTSSASANASSNSSSSKEVSVEQLPLSRETELGVSREVLKVEVDKEAKVRCSLDVGLQLSELQISKNLFPSTKSKGRRLPRKSDGVSKRRSKVSNSARSKKANGGNRRKSISKNKAKDKSVCDHVVCNDEDDPKTGNHIADDWGKNSTSDIIASIDVANLDMASSGLMEQYLAADNAWVRCDECYKWRRIPVALVDSIGQTNCQWICKDNTDKAFADCSIPQEKSNAEINAELGMSDADEDACDVLSNNRGLERRTSVSKEYEFMRITTNQFLHRSRKTQTIDEIMVCHCKARLDGGLGCGDECLNRMLNIECVQGTCPCGDLCSNQQFQRRNYAKMSWERCGKKGFGLRLEENISKGQFLIEYVGEVLDMHTYEARQKEYAFKGHKHFYFMTLDGSEVIDACAKGNLGRFINHSCDPNCRTEKWVVNGEICIGLFALRDIKKGEEVTFDYNYVRVVGAAAKKCYCGSPQCRGYIGGDPTNTEVIDQVDSDEEFPEPIMLEDGEAGDSFKNTISKAGGFVDVGISKHGDKIKSSMASVGKLEVASEIYESINQSGSPISQPHSTLEMNEMKGNVIEETMTKTSCSTQTLETSPSTILSKSSSDGIGAVRKSKSYSAEDKRVFVKSRFFIKTSRQSACVKKGKVTSNPANVNKVQIMANKPQILSIKPKKLLEGTSNGRFEAVQEKLNELLDAEGGISKRKDAPKSYLKLLLLTAASGASRNGEAIHSNRDLSMILDALLKTKSRVVLMDIINKNGLRMLHNIMKQYRRDFKKIPILRKLLKVLEYLAVREILTLEHISKAPPCPGMESFTESMLSLTEHDDKQVHQIARNFRDRWIPRHVRKLSYMDRDDGRVEFHRNSNCNRVSASHSQLHDQGARQTEEIDFFMQSKLATTSADTAVNEGSSAPYIGSSTKTRKRKSRWDQPAEEKPASRSLQYNESKMELLQQSESNPLPVMAEEMLGHADKVGGEYSYCPHCARNYRQQDDASSADVGRLNIHEDAPPGFSSPINPTLVLSNAASNVTDVPHQNACHLKLPVNGVGLPQRKFISRLPVSYGIPLPIVQQFGSPQDETVESWVIAPGMPFYPFPPLPPCPCDKKETPPCAVDSMAIDETAEQGQQDSHDPAACPNENNPRTNGANHPDMDIPDANDHQTFKRARGSSFDLGRRYFRQQKWNKMAPPWVRNRNGWGYIGDNSRGGMCSTDIGNVTNDHRNSYSQDVSCRVEKAGNYLNEHAQHLNEH